MHGFGDKRPHRLSDVENVGPSKLSLAINLVRMIKNIHPSLAIIDGVDAMEGDGPAFRGIHKKLGLIIASTDFIAADTITTYIAGMQPDDLQYIKQTGKLGLGKYQLDEIEIIGEKLDSVISPFKPHHLFPRAHFTSDEISILEKNII